MTTPRTPTAVDALAEAYLDAAAAHDPTEATYYGIPGHDHELPEYSPDWYAERADLRRRTLAGLDDVAAADTCDRITLAALREDLECALDLRATGAEEAHLNNIESPLQGIRDIFDLTPTRTVRDWATVAERLGAVPNALRGYTASLRLAAGRGQVAARRQVNAGIQQCGDNVGPDGFFATFAAAATADDGGELPVALRGDLARNARAASDAYDHLAGFLREELLPRARTTDAFGSDAYPLHSRLHVGARVDLEETYAWGQEELARITAELAATAERIRPGATVREAVAVLDVDPDRRLAGTDALQAWMQETADAAIAALAGTHFDIPDPIRTLACRIAPTQQGGVYYSGPSEDLVTRPGTMWWSVPKGVTEFATWRERTTVYHEGVPGHHLQIAQTVYRRELLNRWRRLAAGTSGHAEGWALYAERLMADLGFLDDPDDYLGMLDGQALRAARVVLDIGVHCELPAPVEVGGGRWTYDKAWRFLRAHSLWDDPFLRFELDRYLGWPGQAPSYKIGERLWLQLRDEVRARQGASFDLAAFHRSALDLGSLSLDVLRPAVLGDI